MRIAKKEPAVGPQPDLSPYNAGRQSYLDGASLDVGMRRYGCVTRDQSASFARGYRQECADAYEARTGEPVDIDDPRWNGVSPY